MIKDVKWNYDAANRDIVFVHVKDEDDNNLTLEIERRRGDRPFSWIIRNKRNFEVRVL